MTLILTTLIALTTTDPFFPLQDGRRFIYGLDGNRSLVLQVVPWKKHHLLQIEGGPFLWAHDGLIVSVDAKGLHAHGTRTSDRIHAHGKSMLIPARLVKDASWSGRVGLVEFTGRAIRREKAQTPSGPHDAWRIELSATKHGLSTYDWRVWFAPGVGFVRAVPWRRSSRSGARKDPIDNPRTLELLSTRVRRVRPPGTKPAIPARVKKDSLQVIARATAKTIRVGAPLPLAFELRNVGQERITVVRNLDGSDAGLRTPLAKVEIRDPRGHVVAPPAALERRPAKLRKGDLRDLEPGEGIDPFAGGAATHRGLGFRPDRAGVWSVRLVYDTSGDAKGKWVHPRRVWDRMLPLRLWSVPRGRYASSWVKFEVVNGK